MIPIEEDHLPQNSTWMVYLLIFVNTIAFLFFYLNDLRHFSYSLPSQSHIIQHFGFRPHNPALVTLVTSMFIHANILHLIGNMYALWLFGDNVEDVLGAPLFLLMYLLFGLSGDLVHKLLFPLSETPVIGASGAISGIMGMYIMFFPHVKLTLVDFSVEKYSPLKISAFLMVMFWLISNMILGFRPFLGFTSEPSNIAYFGHIGGAIAGIFAALVLVRCGFMEFHATHVERGMEDTESVGPDRGLGIGRDVENMGGAFLWEGFFNCWRFVFDAPYRAQKRYALRKQASTFSGAVLVFIEILITVSVGIFGVAAIVLYLIGEPNTVMFFESLFDL